MSKLFDALQRGRTEIRDLDAAGLIGPQMEPATAPAVPQPAAEGSFAEGSALTPASILGIVPADGAADRHGMERRRVHLALPQRSPALPFADDHWQANEQYRILRTKILQHVAQPKVLLVSSAGPGDGKSITAINLAGALSLRTESSVLLVDGDFRKPAIHVQLGIAETPGLAEVLEGECELQDAIMAAEELPNLNLMAAGAPKGNPAELLASNRWLSIATLLRSQFKYIVIDSPPIASVADYDLLQTVCDGVVIVVRPDHTNRVACRQALESVPKEKLIGVVMNCVTEWFLGRGYGYSYQPAYYPRKK